MRTLKPEFETSANVREWQYLRGPDFEAMDRERTVVVVTLSPLEVHGPHLPVITDNLEAEALAFGVMEKINEHDPDIEFVHLPSIYVAADVLPHPGSLMFRSSTIIRVVEDIGRSLARQGFRDIWVVSFHGGPRHFVPIEQACHTTNQRYGTRMVSAFSLLINALTGGGTDLSDLFAHIDGVERDDLVGDSHGGAVETALMLHILGEEHIGPHEDLPRRTVDLRLEEQGKEPLNHPGARPTIARLFRGFKEKLLFYEQETYSGKPSVATAEMGAAMLETLSERAAEVLLRVLRREIPLSDCHSPLWKVRWIFTKPAIGWGFEKLMGYRNRVW